VNGESSSLWLNNPFFEVAFRRPAHGLNAMGVEEVRSSQLRDGGRKFGQGDRLSEDYLNAIAIRGS